MLYNFGLSGGGKKRRPPKFGYTGTYLYEQSVDADGVVHWELALLTSGTLRFTRVVNEIDVFLVGGGAEGYVSVFGRGGHGGAGGERVTEAAVAVRAGSEYAVTIGGSKQNTTAFGLTARTGYGSAGGTGAYVQGLRAIDEKATAGADGAYAFGAAASLLNSGWLYGAGGGGSGMTNPDYVTNGAARGGYTGGGYGGSSGSHNGKAGAANTGSGGGGGFYSVDHYSDHGTGGSGIVILRDAR